MAAGTITALRAQAHESQRVNLFIDGEFALGVSLNTIAQEGLYVGKVLDEAAWLRLRATEYHNKALQLAMRYLDSRPRSAAELREKLTRKEIPPEAIDSALARLQELGLVDDAAFARYWVENRQILRPRGTQALRDELRRKGIDRNVIEATVRDEELVGDQSAGAWQLARKALRKYAQSPDKQTFQRRMGGYLQRRGFSFDVIRPVIDGLWLELREAADRAELAEPDDEL
jgi:regulatory protein